ncbi:MAG: NTP transferase domain-containing protein [Tannerellaceae bacterium]|nr:NTP transferase domain-containing protein [Tannerellaceae bacterium]
MKNKLHVIMPMAGAGSRFYKHGFMLPKPLIEIHNKPFFVWAAESITKYIQGCDVTFVVMQKHIAEHGINRVIKMYFPDAGIVAVSEEEVKNGPVMTCLAGIREIHDNVPILFNDCDHMFCCRTFNEVVGNGGLEADGALLTFQSIEPQFSYIKIDSTGKICGTVEKQVVSDQAICGAYYIKDAETFKQVAEQYLQECNYSEFFVSGVYNVMCSKGMEVSNYEVDFHVPFGTPEEYEVAKGSEYFYHEHD